MKVPGSKVLHSGCVHTRSKRVTAYCNLSLCPAGIAFTGPAFYDDDYILTLPGSKQFLKLQSFSITTDDHVRVKAYSWLPGEQPVAVLQIAHGMQEHALRYDHFARWMNDNRIAVYANDHIGHGASAENLEEISHFPRKDDWQRSVDILYKLTLKIHEDHPGLPVFLLGHSMGSVLTHSYMIRFGKDADGYILSGAIRQPLIMANVGRLLVKLLTLFYGPKDRSKLIIFLGYGQYNKRFSPNRSSADWLCSENKVVDDYINSPLCGVPLTNRFYQNFFYGFNFIARHSNLKKIPGGTHVYIVAGQQDPAGFFGKAPLKIKHLLSKYAQAKVSLKLYPESRHEILNEKNREEVYRDVMEWMSKSVGRRA